MSDQLPLQNIAQAIYTINRHAKTALEPQHLYTLKKETIYKLLKEKRAEKIGLHFSKPTKYSNQSSTLLVKINNYYFHLPPTKNDFKELKHLGSLDQSYRNPHVKMSLSKAKKIIYQYLNWHPKKRTQQRPSSYYIPSSLGRQMKWPPTRSTRSNFD